MVLFMPLAAHSQHMRRITTPLVLAPVMNLQAIGNWAAETLVHQPVHGMPFRTDHYPAVTLKIKRASPLPTSILAAIPLNPFKKPLS
jgi:hypothetical protein